MHGKKNHKDWEKIISANHAEVSKLKTNSFLYQSHILSEAQSGWHRSHGNSEAKERNMYRKAQPIRTV